MLIFSNFILNLSAFNAKGGIHMSLQSHRVRLAILVVFGYSFTYYSWLIIFEDVKELKYFGGGVFSILAPVIAALFLYLNIKRLGGKRKKFGVILLVSCFNYLIAELIWRYYTFYLDSHYIFLGWADLFWILNLLFYAFALLYKVYEKEKKYHILQLFFDVSIIMSVLITAVWVYLLKPALFEKNLSVFHMGLSLGYSIGTLGVLLGSILLYLSYKRDFPPYVLYLNLIGMIIYVMAESIYLYQEIFFKFERYSLLQPVWSICILLIGLSSFFENEREEPKQTEIPPLFRWNRVLTPYVSISLLIVLAIFKESELFSIFIGATIVLCLIIIKQVIILLENDSLFRRLQQSNEILEFKVKERTVQLSLKNKELSYLNQHLEEKVHERTRELEEIKYRLSESEQRYRSLFQNYPDTIVLFDLKGKRIQSNHATPNFLNTCEEILVNPFRENATIIHFQQAIQGKTRNFEVSTQHGDGRVFYYNVTFVPVIIDEKIVEIFGIFQDFTEKKRTEELARKSEKLEIVSHLAASISHEVRNPLTVTKGFMQMFYEDLAEDSKKQLWDIAIQELDRAAEIINDYLMFAKPAIENKEMINIWHELQHAVTIVMPLANMNTVQVNSPLRKDENVFVLGDRQKLQQCLINILKNGIEAMPNGGELQVRLHHLHSDFQIDIRDSGKGMTQEQINRLGEPYFTTKEKGTGLGMMVSFSIIRGMNGSINVTSDPQNGTCFSIKLPLYQEIGELNPSTIYKGEVYDKTKGISSLPITKDVSKKMSI